MKILIVAVIGLLLLNCATHKKPLKTPRKFDEIAFGNMGGVTGAQNNYLLKANGDVLKLADAVPVKVNDVPKSVLKDISKQIRLNNLYGLEQTGTGNMTYFIELKAGDISNKITWGAGSENDTLTETYKKLISTLKPKSNE